MSLPLSCLFLVTNKVAFDFEHCTAGYQKAPKLLDNTLASFCAHEHLHTLTKENTQDARYTFTHE